MEITETKKTYPRWVGLLLGFLLPGSAHYFAGKKRAGLIWCFSLLVFPRIFTLLLTIHSRPVIIAGLILMLLTAFFHLAMLVSSFRHVERLNFRRGLAIAGLMFAAMMLPQTVQVFKMSAQSMQPTLLGLSAQQSTNQTSFADGLLRGMVYEEFRVTEPGPISGQARMGTSGIELTIGEQTYVLPREAMQTLKLEKEYKTGDILWSGTLTAQDHLVVKPYYLSKPARGDIVVFSTSSIDHPNVNTSAVYTKRIVGLPGETIHIDPPFIIAGGKPIKTPAIFEQLDYLNDGKLAHSTNSITLGENEYFVLGDNTAPGQSLDSRYFGAITETSLIGRVCSIYWPLSRIQPVD